MTKSINKALLLLIIIAFPSCSKDKGWTCYKNYYWRNQCEILADSSFENCQEFPSYKIGETIFTDETQKENFIKDNTYEGVIDSIYIQDGKKYDMQKMENCQCDDN
jgi:hypothetical protein